jgi:carboxynorspermidine decarboxylase
MFDAEADAETLCLLDGIHFHTLCEQDSDALKKTADAVIKDWDDILKTVRWINMGGGHHITKEGYNIPLLEKVISKFRKKYDLQVYLEPGEAVALNAGYLVCRVLDIVENSGVRTAIVDASAACHMPDVIEMPYTPPLYGAEGSGEGRHVYRLAGPTCLAGDVIGEYSFGHDLREGELLLFGDMAIYSMCKNNTFNGMPLPDIWKRGADGSLARLAGFGYADFKMRLGNRCR